MKTDWLFVKPLFAKKDVLDSIFRTSTAQSLLSASPPFSITTLLSRPLLSSSLSVPSLSGVKYENWRRSAQCVGRRRRLHKAGFCYRYLSRYHNCCFKSTKGFQTAVPFIFCHIPSMIFLSIPFLQSDFSFGQYSLIFTWTTTAVKFIDPLIVMALVPDYRRAVCKVFGRKFVRISIMTRFYLQ